MQKVGKCYMLILGNILFGFALLLLFQGLKMPGWFNSLCIAILFLLLNLLYTRWLKLYDELEEYWSVKKLHYLLIGIVPGACIAAAVPVLALLAGVVTPAQLTIDKNISLTAILTTLLIVLWEELWFRGLLLNYCRRYLSVAHISILMGLLFMLMHVFNPAISLLKTGPSLFFAGAMLTALYFYYKSIWLCVGLHLGNNYFGSKLTMPDGIPILFSPDGYLNATVLGIITIVYLWRMRRKEDALTSK